jgi:hypothetical protein
MISRYQLHNIIDSENFIDECKHLVIIVDDRLAVKSVGIVVGEKKRGSGLLFVVVSVRLNVYIVLLKRCPLV